ncbi:TetR/AcrR family transcriptional regulator [Novosphingobium sp. BL-8A]|uniref:TetR/AcrR family transcriptional regulator n=1 Tax=Novosphingobium sp. BL-8A TaxID=3127639 RepID=UPI003756A0C1
MNQAKPGAAASETSAVRPKRPVGRGRPSREQSAAITDAIVAVASEMFLRDGFDGVSMEAVANAVRIPKTTLYKRYPDKMALLNAVLASRVASWSQVTTPLTEKLGNDFRARMVNHTAIMFEWSTKPEVRAYTRLMLSAAGRGPGDVGVDFFGYSHMVDFLTGEISRYGPQAGVDTKDPERIAQFLMAIISGWLRVRRLHDPLTSEEARTEAEYVIDVMMRGIDAW